MREEKKRGIKEVKNNAKHKVIKKRPRTSGPEEVRVEQPLELELQDGISNIREGGSLSPYSEDLIRLLFVTRVEYSRWRENDGYMELLFQFENPYLPGNILLSQLKRFLRNHEINYKANQYNDKDRIKYCLSISEKDYFLKIQPIVKFYVQYYKNFELCNSNSLSEEHIKIITNSFIANGITLPNSMFIINDENLIKVYNAYKENRYQEKVNKQRISGVMDEVIGSLEVLKITR